MYGLSGSHRSGKTTLARLISDALKLPFVGTRTSHVFTRHKLDPNGVPTPQEREFIQWEILADAVSLWQNADHKQFISDRTPLDMIVYANALPNSEYYQRCIEYTNQFFGTIMIVQPAIKIVAEPNKALSGCDEFNSKIIRVCDCGELTSDTIILPESITDINHRFSYFLRNVVLRHLAK